MDMDDHDSAMNFIVDGKIVNSVSGRARSISDDTSCGMRKPTSTKRSWSSDVSVVYRGPATLYIAAQRSFLG